jgi:hypothetical protein
MRDLYLGDSYDFVKRFWAESLRSIAPIYAHSQFVPDGMRKGYTAMTRIPILDEGKVPKKPFGLLLDPDTGIPLLSQSRVKATRSHAPLAFIVDLNSTLRPAYMICFDQSYHRHNELRKPEQLEKKRAFLQTKGIGSFYFDSHAPFLFMAERDELLSALKERLLSRGIPQCRFVLRVNRRLSELARK